MKKKLLAIAVAGAFAAPTVAMAEWSLSGSVSQSVSAGGSGISLGGGSGSLSMSGSADLGNGVSGSAGFSVTGGGTGSSIGLAGDFGSVHAVKAEKVSTVIDDGDVHVHPDLGGLAFRSYHHQLGTIESECDSLTVDQTHFFFLLSQPAEPCKGKSALVRQPRGSSPSPCCET